MSFDPEDAANNDGLHFRPTFFVKDYLSVKSFTAKVKYDVAFTGTLHSNRHKIIKSLCDQFTKQGLSFYIYLYVPSILVYLKDLIIKFPYIGISKVHFNPISLHETINILDESIAVFDINYTGQKSLSTRAYEAMAAGRKYITTNSEVKLYDFYNPNNILVVNIDNVVIPRQFLDTPFEPVSEQILYKYSVAGLIDDLLNETFNSKSIFLPGRVQNQRFDFSTGSKRTFSNCVNR